MRRLARTGMVVVLAAGTMAGMTATAAVAQTTGIATHTILTTASAEIGGRTVATYSAKVLGEDGLPATGVVELVERGRVLAGAALNPSGEAEIRADGLAAGEHQVYAIYGGDETHASSRADGVAVDVAASDAPAFALSIAPATIKVATPGDSGALVATVTPTGGFTGFVTLSCSGAPASAGASGGSALPVGVSCAFTPQTLQVASKALTSDMSLQTLPGQTTPTGFRLNPRQRDASHRPLILAILLPGAVGLGMIGRKRKALGRVLLVLLIGAIGIAGTSACNARYKYLNHGPTFSGTPVGSFTLTVTAQTSNGVTASTQSQTLTLVVQ